MPKTERKRSPRSWWPWTLVVCAVVTGAGRRSSTIAALRDDPCCSAVRTQYGYDVIYQLTSLALTDFHDVDFRCRHRICALDPSTRFGIVYFGGEGMATADIFSCDTQSGRFGGNTGRFSPSTKHVLAGPCLCVNVEVLGWNVSRLSEGLQPSNSRLVILASFYDGETRRLTNSQNDKAVGRKLAVQVAYTCSSSEIPVHLLTEPNSPPSNGSTVRNSTEHPLNVTEFDNYGAAAGSDNYAAMSSDNHAATGSDNYVTSSTWKSVSETAWTRASVTQRTGRGGGWDGKVKSPNGGGGAGNGTSGATSSFAAAADSTDHLDLTGWIVSVGVSGGVIVCLLIFSACLFVHHLRYHKTHSRLSSKPSAIKPAATNLEQAAYQNEIFSPEVAHNQSAYEQSDVRAPAAMATFGVNQSPTKLEHAVSRLAQREMYTLDLSHPSTADEKASKEAANTTSSPECLELEGSDFSDDDFFFDDFDEFCPSESVI